jgi:hypothetical protein
MEKAPAPPEASSPDLTVRSGDARSGSSEVTSWLKRGSAITSETKYLPQDLYSKLARAEKKARQKLGEKEFTAFRNS